METSTLEYQSRMIDSRALNELPDHSRQQRATEVEFFAEPPTEIGKVQSAESTLRPGRQPMPLPLRLLIGTVVGGALLFGGYQLAHDASSADRDTLIILGYVFGAAAL